jgi:hypothetical protein
LAGHWLGWRTIQFCDINQFGQKVVEYHFPGVPFSTDIKTLTGESIKNNGLYDQMKQASWLEDSLVNPTQWQGKEKEQTMLDISGQSALDLLESSGRISVFGRTFLALLIGQEGWFSSRCALIWKVKGTKYNRLYCQLQVSTLRTGEIGSGLLPTVTTQEAETITTELTESGRRLTKDGTDSHSLNLGRMAKMALLPTPDCSDRRSDKSTQWGLSNYAKNGLLKTPTKMDGEVTSGKKNPVSGDSGTLAQEIMSGYEPTMQKLGMIPTPTQRDHKGGNSLKHLTRQEVNENGKIKDNHINQLPNFIKVQTGQTGQLSPHFVMEMMGFPPDWTELPFLNGETNQ